MLSRRFVYQLLMLWNTRGREDFFFKRTFALSLVLLIFTTGVFVGKRFSDSQTQIRFAQLSNCENRFNRDIATVNQQNSVEGTSISSQKRAVDPLQTSAPAPLTADEMAREKAILDRKEQERLAKEKADQEKQAREKAGQDELTKAKAELAKVEKEEAKAKQGKLAREKAELERLAKENEEQERLIHEAYEKEVAKQKQLAREATDQKKNTKKLNMEAERVNPEPEIVAVDGKKTAADFSVMPFFKKTFSKLTEPSPTEEKPDETRKPTANAEATSSKAASPTSAPSPEQKDKKFQKSKKTEKKVESTGKKNEDSKRKHILSEKAIGTEEPIAGRYTIQVYSTEKEAEASSTARKLHDKGLSAFYIETKFRNDHTVYYRVCVGLFDGRKNAEKYLSNVLSKDGSSKNAWVRRVTTP